jgi:surface antigen
VLAFQAVSDLTFCVISQETNLQFLRKSCTLSQTSPTFVSYRKKMPAMKRTLIVLFLISLLGFASWKWKAQLFNLHDYEIGQAIDSLNHVIVYYNGNVGHVMGRNVTGDGYNLGLKYQCVEFVKRYYYEYYKHKMPDSYGNAKDFFDASLPDGAMSPARNLRQFNNPSKSRPQTGDLLILDGHLGNPYGHVAIIADVKDDEIQIIQQNPGPGAHARIWIDLIVEDGKFKVDNGRTLGWLRK